MAFEYTLSIGKNNEAVIRFNEETGQQLVFILIYKGKQDMYTERGSVIAAENMQNSSTVDQSISNQTTSAIELRNVTKRFRTPTGAAYTAIRDLSLSVKEAVLKLGFVFILMSVAFVIYNDISKILPPG